MPELSRRELQVARLVAQGLTNKEIAAQLGISRRTVETQVDNARGKLGCANRAELAARVARQG